VAAGVGEDARGGVLGRIAAGEVGDGGEAVGGAQVDADDGFAGRGGHGGG
jgi:hypothetical protein